MHSIQKENGQIGYVTGANMGARASKTQSFVLRQKRWMHTQTQRHFLEHLNVASFKHDRHKSSAQLHEFHNPKLHISFQKRFALRR